MAKTVLIFRSDYLPVSETFISDHLRSLSQYVPLVACEKDTPATHRIALTPTVIAKTWLERKLFQFLGWSRAFDQILAKNRPDLVHAHFLTDAVKILPLMERNSLPFVVTAHGYDATIYDSDLASFPEGALLLKRRARLIKRVDKILCVSEFIRNELLKRGYPAAKLVVSHLGVDLSALDRRTTSAADARGILFVGRLVEKKGARYLIEAYSKLTDATRAKHPLKIVGDGPLRNELERLATTLNVLVEFLGAQPRSVVVDQLRRAAVFVLPSVRADNGDAEGMPIAIMEALAMGVPVCIFNDQPMASLLTEKRAGVLAMPSDAGDLAIQIETLLANTTHADAICDAGRSLVEETFNLFTNTRKLEAVYDSVISALPRSSK